MCSRNRKETAVAGNSEPEGEGHVMELGRFIMHKLCRSPKKLEIYSKSNGNKTHECSQRFAFDFQLQGKGRGTRSILKTNSCTTSYHAGMHPGERVSENQLRRPSGEEEE